MRTSRACWVAVVVVGALLLGGCGDDGGSGTADPTPATTAPSLVADDTWCAGWLQVVSTQGQYVAEPGPEAAAAVLAAVEALRTLGVPESLDPAGYGELNAVLDDVQASVDPSFTPSVTPSEPADVATGDHEHGHDVDEAPFGAWLAEYCAG